MEKILLIFALVFGRAVFGLDESSYAASIRGVIEPIHVEEEYGEYFEGDMVLTEEQKLAIYLSNFSRNGLVDTTKRWPENTFVYAFTENEFSDYERSLISNAMQDIANNSCIVFRERVNNEYAVRISNASQGCFSSVGFLYYDNYPRNDQVLNLGRGCLGHGTIVHEMLHALGFYHMQSTYNRDDYVQIVWNNIQSGKEHNFYKYDNTTVTDFCVPYDFGSVMHYSSRAFSKNGRRTIIPLQQGVTIGQRRGMSESDIKKLNRMYCYNVDVGDK